MRFLFFAVLLLYPLATALAAGRALTIDDLLAVKGVADPQVSPDGKSVVYVVSESDRKTHKTVADLWLVPLAGGEPKRLTTAPGMDQHPRFSPDGKTIAFLSDRSGSTQVWLLPLDGGEATQATHLPIDVSGPIWSPNGDAIAFTASVYPGASADLTAEKDKKKAEPGESKARIYDDLMFRHWTAWDEGKRSHLFLLRLKTGETIDLTPDFKSNIPPGPFGGSNEYAFSADGRSIAFTAEPIKDHAFSTNTDIWIVPTSGGAARNLTESNRAADAQPAFSPDGKTLAYVRQNRPGFEADLWTLVVHDLTTAKTTDVSSFLDRPVLSFRWADWSGSYLYAVLDDAGGETIAEIFVPEAVRGKKEAVKRLIRGGVNSAAAVKPPAIGKAGDQVPPDADLVYLHNDSRHPNELMRAKADGSEPTRLTRHNDELLSALDLKPAESFWFKGADGDDVQGFLVKPPGFHPDKKYPVLLLIHGGPQGAWHDDWHARWNLQLFAAPGYAVVAVNPRGSSGFGQKFTDQISQDWTGRVFVDLMNGLDHVLRTHRFLDGDRVGAAGGSYGGFMVNWIAGHTDRFRCLISHAGVFDLAAEYGATEELWFPEWEFAGPPWTNLKMYDAQSPSRFCEHFKTPALVIHGALDYRVPDTQGMAMFTALRRQGVPSRFVYFPDEGHWILKPQNRVVWWHEVHGWLDKYLK